MSGIINDNVPAALEEHDRVCEVHVYDVSDLRP
jgi:hypothetical protein